MKFSDVIGLDTIKRQLIQDVEQNKIAHAQLFVGNAGFGVLPLVIAYAQYINCENRHDGDSCGVCNSCYKIGQLQHPDLHFVFPVNKSVHAKTLKESSDIISDSLLEKWREIILNESKPSGYFRESQWYNIIELGKNAQGNIARSEANEIIRKMNYKSYEGGYKIVIIWLSERMNDTAANALLKLFEEPTEKTLFLLISEETESILKTILSRTRVINIPPIDSEEIVKYVNQYNNDPQQCRKIASVVCGDVIRAADIVFSREETSKENLEYFMSLMRLCFAVNHIGLLEWAEKMATLPREVQKRFVAYSLNMLREAFMLSINMDILSFCYGAEVDFIKKFSDYVHHENINTLLAEFEKVNKDIMQNGNPKIIFSHFVLAISKQIYKL